MSTQPDDAKQGSSGLPQLAADAGTEFIFEADEVIFDEGDDSDFAYIVIEGSVEMTKMMEGTEVFLAEIGPGQLFGEMGLIDGSVRSATAATLSETTLQRINKEQLMQRLSSDTEFAAPVITQLVGQLRETSSKLAHQQVLSLKKAADATDIIVPKRRGPVMRLRTFFDAEADFIEFQPDAVEIERQPVPAIVTVSVFTILALVVSAFVWASFSSIDTAVSATGRITTEVPNIVVQPSDTAVIRSIRVKEGAFVKKGQLLATLDSTIAESDVQASLRSLTSLLAEEKRLEREFSGLDSVQPFSSNKAENLLQQELYDRRQASISQKLSSFDQQIGQLTAEISVNAQDARDLGEQAVVLKEIENMRAKLLDSGHGSRVNYLTSKHQRLSIDREKRGLLSRRSMMEFRVKALQADRRVAMANWRSQVARELVDTRRLREGQMSQLEKTEHRESLVKLIAPADGIVLKIAERSVGSVIRQAETLFTIVPADVPMEMEVDIQPKDIGLIQVGDLVRVKLDALPFQAHGIIEGRVRLIGEDAEKKEDSNSGSTIYRTRIELLDRKLIKVPSTFRMTPGLTGSADITVGKRLIVTYFIYPLVRAFSSSLREP